jgi:hypothetical protein
MERIWTDETEEIALSDQQTRDTTTILIDAGCSDEEIRAWMREQARWAYAS